MAKYFRFSRITNSVVVEETDNPWCVKPRTEIHCILEAIQDTEIEIQKLQYDLKDNKRLLKQLKTKHQNLCKKS